MQKLKTETEAKHHKSTADIWQTSGEWKECGRQEGVFQHGRTAAQSGSRTAGQSHGQPKDNNRLLQPDF